MAKAKILIVDDETKWAERGFLEELKLSGFEFEHKTDIDEAVAYLSENLDSIDLLILDIMMPPGKSFEGTTDQGFDTGIEFYERFRPLAPKLPILIFTNVPSKEVAQKFLTDKNCWFYQKIDLLPFELVEEIEEILADKS
jgi:CheY-like chemotaxis protein